jgi:hypothetical protein
MLAVVAVAVLAVAVASLPLMADVSEDGRLPESFVLRRDLRVAFLLGLGVACVLAPAIRMLMLSEGESRWLPVLGLSLGIGLSAAAVGAISRWRYAADVRSRQGDVDDE